MNLNEDTLSLFYLSTSLLVLCTAIVAAWIGPRMAVSLWHMSRKATKETTPSEINTVNSKSLDFCDAVGRPETISDYVPVITLPESSDTFTLTADAEATRTEKRRAYLKLQQCYNPSANPARSYTEEQSQKEELPSDPSPSL